MRIEELTPVDVGRRLDEVVDVYARALELPPNDPSLTVRWRNDVFPLHASRPQFRFVAALDGEQLVGFGYGYQGALGQWWTDRIARHMTREDRARWLAPPHFEVVELHVTPERQREGVGTKLHERLLAGLELPFALLSTWEGNKPALRFYAKHGWREIVRGVDFASRRGLYVILARELTGSRWDSA